MKKILIYMVAPLLLLADLLPFQTIQKAKGAYQRGAYERSALLFNQLDSNRSILSYNMANAYYKAKQYNKAIKAYQNAKGVDEATRLYNIGNCYFQQDKLDQAMVFYKNALRLRDDEDTRHNLALAKRKKEKQEQEKNKQKDKKKKKKKAPKKQQQDKKKDREKENSEKKKPNKKQAEDAKKREEQAKMTPQERLTQKELKRLMKKLNEQKMPTMMYQVTPPTGVRDDSKPW